MKRVPNHIIETLVRNLPIVLAHTDTTGASTRVVNAVRLTKKCIDKLTKINNDGK